MANGNEIIALLGKAANDPEVLDLLKHFAVRWPPELEVIDEDDELEGESDWYVWRPSSRMGIEFGFQDEAHLKALAVDLRGRSPLVLSSVTFYGQHEGVRPYQGVLPYGLMLNDSRATVRKKLSVLGTAPRSHLRDVWEPPPHRIVVQHVLGPDIIDSVLFRLRLAPWPPLDESPPVLPTVNEIVGLFGLPWHAPQMRKIFSPLGLDACGPDIAKHRYADLRETRGLELYFFREPNRDPDSPIRDKGAAFSGVKFFRSRTQDARDWAGELPFGLSFDEAYPDFMNKIGRAPDDGHDGPLTGHALWHFPEFTLHLLYDNVDNVILCVSLFQPGTWKQSGIC